MTSCPRAGTTLRLFPAPCLCQCATGLLQTGCAAGCVGVCLSPPAADWYSQLRASRPASVTGVSHRFSTWSIVRCSDRSRRPASPNCGTTWVLSLGRPRGGNPKVGQEWEGVGSVYEAMPSFQHSALCPEFRSSFSSGHRPGKGLYQSLNLGSET